MKFAEGLLLPGEIRKAVRAARKRIDSGKAAHVPRKCWHGFQGVDGMHLLMVERYPDGSSRVFEQMGTGRELVSLTD